MTKLATLATTAFDPDAPRRVGVAVSGGSDSMATLHLLAPLYDVHAVTVDHGLRPEAAAEAEFVAAACARLGVPHVVLHWAGAEATGNLMDAARRARMRLIGAWAREQGLDHVALGHTADDQAETFLMRLAREAGLEGLSGMRRSYLEEGVRWHRPLLDVTRAELRSYLRQAGVSWVDDPSNSDPRFERVRARMALAGLSDIGITPDGLARVVGHLAQARAALDAVLEPFVAEHVVQDPGALRIDKAAFAQGLPPELQRRFLNAALIWVSGAQYPPRAAKLERFLHDLAPCTLHGCHITQDERQLIVSRELKAVADLRVPIDESWDNWRLEGPGATYAPGLEIAALGAQGLCDCVNWRATGLPRETVLASPAVWAQEKLVAAPIAGFENGWKARKEAGSFATTIFRR
ncbi:tRNA lysidine(34) synthetase TilS [Thioclava sp. 15-R06ZXC-3]|uniref:tRNA(Ile)-lysidine synthase n=1 Tax=Thioclava arctica TaxID=3238301 RepID=A0ABV3TJ90_9RHOB